MTEAYVFEKEDLTIRKKKIFPLHDFIVSIIRILIIISLLAVVAINAIDQMYTRNLDAKIQELDTKLQELRVYQGYIDSVKYLPLTKENIYILCDKYNIKYPDVVVAQAQIESGNFKSSLCTEHNNLFGMKIPYRRFSVRSGKANNYAKYDHWSHSVIDYGILQNMFADLSSKENYLKWLDATYAEDPNYIQKINRLIK
jgi:hypothetical protein